MSFPSEPKSISNRILSALPSQDYHRLVDHGHQVALGVGTVLYESNEPIRDVYFPLGGLAAVGTALQDAVGIEVLAAGREAIIGLPALAPPGIAIATRALMHIAGHAIRVNSTVVRDEFDRGGALQTLLLRYFQFTLVQVSQSVACNRLHDVQERMARWLLMVQDRMESSMFTLSHDSLDCMLGMGRSPVPLAIGILERAGVIEQDRGQIRILDREQLENVACECYRVIRKSWDQLLGNPQPAVTEQTRAATEK